MIFKLGFFIALVVVPFSNSFGASVEGVSGALEFLNKLNGEYKSVVYEGGDGKVVRPLDDGLNFNFNASSISSDKSYAVVQFSEEGTLEEDSGSSVDQEIFLCAFVRMSDGCVVSVEQGAQCGGEWAEGRAWRSSVGRDNGYILDSPPTVSGLYDSYSAGRGGSETSTPRVLNYLMEGTTFSNVLVCDPPKSSNGEGYLKLLELLRRDGDVMNYSILRSVMRGHKK